MGRREIQESREVFAHSVPEGSQPFCVKLSHSPDVTYQMSFDDEIAENRLIGTRRIQIHPRAESQESINEGCRQNHISHTQRWKHHFVETAEQDHGAVPVQALEGGYRLVCEAIFAVVVVLKNECSGAPRPVENGKPALDWHDHTQLELVRRSQVSNLRAIAQLAPFRQC